MAYFGLFILESAKFRWKYIPSQLTIDFNLFLE